MKFEKCPRCDGVLLPSKTMAGNESTFWKECSNPFCGTMVDTFEPTTMQHNFAKDDAKFKGTFGGFGSGKSGIVIKDVEKHAFITPNGYIAVIGFTFRQIYRNFLKDFTEQFPVKFVVRSGNQKIPGFNQSENKILLKNGCQIELITADQEGKIRGLNATKIVVLEASNVPGPVIETSKSRMRNMAAAIEKVGKNGKIVIKYDPKSGIMVPEYEGDWINMVYESNPDAGYIRKEVLLKAGWVQFYGSSYEKYQYRIGEIDDNISVHISATDSNPYLPADYVEANSKGKPRHEVRRFYFGSFLFSEDMVYPRFHETVVDAYPINFLDRDIYALIGYDYGLYNLSAFVFAAINFRTEKLIAYDELGVSDMDVKEIATEFRKKLRVIPRGKLLMLPQMDANSYGKRQADKQTIGSMFEDAGLFFDPVQESEEARMLKVNTLINNGFLQVMRSCPRLIEEVTDYKMARNSKGELTGKRIDKRNHFIDALEFLTIKLPYNLETMKLYDWVKPGHLIVADKYDKRGEMEFTAEQKLSIKLNPLEQTFEVKYNEMELSDDDFDKIISKMSGI